MRLTPQPWLCILVALPRAGSARLNARSLVNTTAELKTDVLLHEEPGPPLEGCQANFWDKTCCCFIDAGILQQSRCECAGDSRKCERKVRKSYHSSPSRKIVKIPGVPNAVKWKKAEGYLSGFQPVAAEFCMAAPVEGPQIDSHERAFECTCSTSMGNNVEMDCGSSCDVENCKRWNPRKIGWTSFRGTCCLSSYTSATKGCQQEVHPITESHAHEILSDAVKHAALGTKTAFLISTDFVHEMTKSFESAKQKSVSTSRSGAKFFFSGDHAYILKSIHRPEYEVLFKIAHMQESPEKKSLLEHFQWYDKRASITSKMQNCLRIYIEPARDGRAVHLATLLNAYFKGSWQWSGTLSEQYGAPTFEHHNHRAVWCEAASSYRIHRKANDPIAGCETITDDDLYKWLLKLGHNSTDTDVMEVYTDFIKAFEVAPTSSVEKQCGNMNCMCEHSWWPRSLINDFVIAFEYRSTTWMVVRNSVTAVSQDLAQAGFTSFYKGNDIFDVKPFPIHSDQRELLFGMHFSKALMSSWRHWESVRENLEYDVKFLNTVLDNPMVDYSLLVSAFYIKDERMVLDHVALPNCVEQRLAEIATGREHENRDYGTTAHGSILVCFSVIDMLMEFTFSKTPENLLLSKKWSAWGEKMMNMFDCLGNPSGNACRNYQKLHSKFRGLDIPWIETSAVQDITDMMSADGELQAIDPVKKIGRTYKCCCHSERGECKLVGRPGASKPFSLFGLKLERDATGCGVLAGRGWHSYWREAGRCTISREEARQIRFGDMAVPYDGWI